MNGERQSVDGVDLAHIEARAISKGYWCWADKNALEAIRIRFDGKTLKPLAVAVYLALAWIASDKGEEFATDLAYISLRSGASVASVKRILAELEAMTLVFVYRRTHTTSIYKLRAVARGELARGELARGELAQARNTSFRATTKEKKKKRTITEREEGAHGFALAPTWETEPPQNSEQSAEFLAFNRILLAGLRAPARRWSELVTADAETVMEALTSYEGALARGAEITDAFGWIEAEWKKKRGL
jgi:DNA-binding MarR family transcriptional regulator